jgi:stage V sporulation protein D (sporulation-specific penicillin-binding protein)
MLEEILPYLGMNPEYNEAELENLDIKVPILTGSSIDEAIRILDEKGIKHKEFGNGIEVVEQSPMTGKTMAKDGCIYLYTEKLSETEKKVQVPYLIGVSPQIANESLSAYDLNYVAKGVLNAQDGSYVKSQSVAGGSYVPRGTVIELEFETETFTD